MARFSSTTTRVGDRPPVERIRRSEVYGVPDGFLTDPAPQNLVEARQEVATVFEEVPPLAAIKAGDRPSLEPIEQSGQSESYRPIVPGDLVRVSVYESNETDKNYTLTDAMLRMDGGIYVCSDSQSERIFVSGFTFHYSDVTIVEYVQESLKKPRMATKDPGGRVSSRDAFKRRVERLNASSIIYRESTGAILAANVSLKSIGELSQPNEGLLSLTRDLGSVLTPWIPGVISDSDIRVEGYFVKRGQVVEGSMYVGSAQVKGEFISIAIFVWPADGALKFSEDSEDLLEILAEAREVLSSSSSEEDDD